MTMQTAREGIAWAINHIEDCYSLARLSRGVEEATLDCVIKDMTALHYDAAVATLEGFPRQPFLMDDIASQRIHKQLVAAKLSRSELDSVAIMAYFNPRVMDCLL